jgi:HEAT repeat protein
MESEAALFSIENLVPLVWWMAFTVMAIDVVFVLFIFRRRITRRLYYQKKDATIKQFSGEIARFLAGTEPVEELMASLGGTRGKAARNAIQEMLMGGMTRENRQAVTGVFLRLGYIADWSKEAFGRRRARELLGHLADGAKLPPARKRRLARILRLRIFSVRRALAITRLGQLDAAFSEVFMREALADPSPFVSRANVAAIGQNRNQSGITVLLELLRQAVDAAIELPVRPIKIALVRFPLSEVSHFLPFLDSENARFRFVMVDSIREICDASQPQPLSRSDFPDNVVAWFLHRAVHDDSIDVRARSAGVVRHFHTPEAAHALRALLEDANEYVRLHAVRACSDPYYLGLLDAVVARIGDSRWRVREAAVATLATFGTRGRQQLARHFLDTADRYGSEQISEEMQRSGIIMDMLPSLASPNGERRLVMDVCTKMVRLGSSACLTEFLAREHATGIRAPLLDILALSPTAYFLSTIEVIAGNETDPLRNKAQELLALKSASAIDEAGRARAAAAGGQAPHA